VNGAADNTGADRALLTQAALGDVEALAPPPEAPTQLRPYEPSLRLIDGLQQVFKQAAGGRDWGDLRFALAPVLDGAPPTATETALSRAATDFGQALTASPSVNGPPSELLQLNFAAQALAEVGQAVAALPRSISQVLSETPSIAFGRGFLKGGLWAAKNQVTQQVHFFVSLASLVISFYRLVYDVSHYSDIAAIWLLPLDQARPRMEDLMAQVAKDHPALWSVLESGFRLVTALESLRDQFDETKDGRDDHAVRLLGEYLYAIPKSFAQKLGVQLSAAVNAKGDPEKQGEIIGNALVELIIQILLAAAGLRATIQSTIEFLSVKAIPVMLQSSTLLEDAVAYKAVTIEAPFPSEELRASAKVANESTPQLIAAAMDQGAAARRVLIEEYGRLAIDIGPYRLNSTRTMGWNAAARELTGLTSEDIEYAVSLRLDSGHIIEDQWFEKFPDDFKTVFNEWPVFDSLDRPALDPATGQQLVVSWNSAKDMDAIALHTEAHIRSGQRMSEVLGLMGAEGRHPLATEMADFFVARQTKDGVFKPFATLREVIEAHEEYYQSQQAVAIWPRVSTWFARAKAALTKAGL
jgi:PAS domain-containing protein